MTAWNFGQTEIWPTSSLWDWGFRSKSILPDSIRRILSEASVSVVDTLNSFQWPWSCSPKVIPNALSVDFINTKALISKLSSLLLKTHRARPTRWSERISWIDRCKRRRLALRDAVPKYFANSRIRLPLMGTNKISANSHDGCFGTMVRGLKA